MIIQPNEQGWSFSGSLETDRYCLVYKENILIYYGKMDISTTETLFVGTLEECEAEIERLDLPALFKMVIEGDQITFLRKFNDGVDDGCFVGTAEECEKEIERMNLVDN